MPASGPEQRPFGENARFIGRARELGAAAAAFETARAGAGTMLLVNGDAGIGKTRYCEEVADQAEQAGLRVAWGRCWPEGGAPALWPWHDVIRSLGGPAAEAVLEGDRGTDQVDSERFARFSAVLDLVRDRCAETPSLLIIDDIHAADPGALLLTRFVGRSLRLLPLVMVITRRSGEPSPGSATAPLLAELAREARRLTLPGLDREETLAFLESLDARPDGDDRIDALHRLTGGNPLFLQEVAASGIREGLSGPLPAGVQHAVDARLSRLDEATRGVLAVGALLGPGGSVSEIAALTDRSPASVVDCIECGAVHGLVALDDGTRPVFAHELLVNALVASLDLSERLDVHARAAGIVAADDDQPEALARRANHAIEAALRSPEDARVAVDAARSAARALTNIGSYERAALLLSSALDAATTGHLSDPRAALRVEHAEAVLSSGRLGDARALFDQAAKVAEAENDVVSLARAAIGLGGMWVNEQRAPEAKARIQALQERALRRLPPEETTLRCRLEVRLAAEAVYRGAPGESVLEVLARAREEGDEQTLAEALSLCHHSLMDPKHGRLRMALADELIEVASGANQGVLTLLGLCWRAVDLFLAGDARATRALEDLRVRADALQSQSILHTLEAIDVMLEIRAGRLETAEAAANRCFEHGTDVGDADALAYYGMQLLVIRWAQGRGHEILPFVEEIASSTTLVWGNEAYVAAAAGLAGVSGDLDRARVMLDRVTADGLGSIPRSSVWLATLLTVVEAAHALDDSAIAADAYDLLLPFAHLPVMPSLAVVCVGSVERLLGLAAATSGRRDDAVAHLERAVEANNRLGNRPLSAIARADLAGALEARGTPTDIERAASLYDRAVVDGTAMHLDARVAAWSAAHERLARPPTDDRPETAPRQGIFRRDGSHWVVGLGDSQVVVPHSVGMTYLAELLARPGTDVSAMSLVGGTEELQEASRQPLIDDRARAAYRRRIDDINEDLAEAEAFADIERAAKLRFELDALLDELKRTVALGGRDRAFAGVSERARTAVRKAIKRAVTRIAAADPSLGQLFERSVTTGSTCRYAPSDAHPDRWVG